MAQTDHHRRSCWGGFITTYQFFACFNDGKCFGGVDAQSLQHLRCQYFAHPTFKRQAAIATAAVGRGARPLGREVKQAAVAIAHLCKQETATIANVRIIHAKLVAMITQSQWFGHVVG